MPFLDRRLVRLAGRRRPLFAATIAFAVVSAFAAVAQAFALAWVVNAVFLNGATLDDITTPLLALFAVICLRALSSGAEHTTARIFAIQVTNDLRQRVFAHLQTISPLRLAQERTGAIQAALGSGLDDLRSWFGEYLPQTVVSVLVPVSVAAIILTRDPLSALLLTLTAPLIPLFMTLIASAAERQSRQRFSALTRLSAFFLDILQGLVTLKILGRSHEQIENVVRATDELRRSSMEVLRVAFVSALALELLTTLSTAVVAVEVGLRLLYGRLEFIDAFFVLVLAPEFYLPLRLLGQRFHAGMNGAAAAASIFRLLEIPTGCKDPAGHKPGKVHRRSMPANPTLELRAVSFRYPGHGEEKERPALQDVSLRIKKGESIALVGPSGSGKSTVFNLLLRLAEPTTGEVLADGVPACEFNPESWRNRIAWVPQEPHLLADTIYNNIIVGRPGASRNEVMEAARAAYADQFVEALPESWQTRVGEGGQSLSGGEVRRLAMARALLRDAPIMLLDEPAAGLDPLSLSELNRSFAPILRTRSVIVIAHQLDTALSADRVAVFEQGRIVQLGGFAELAGQKGRLHALIAARNQQS